MNRQSKDVFHRISEEAFRKVIAESTSIRQVFGRMGLCVSGDQYKPFRRRVQELQIDLSHFRGSYDPNQRFKSEIPPERMFVLGTTYTGKTLSKKILKLKLLPYRCTKCGNEGWWQNESLCLQLDHINGDTTDNRLENLRFMCPSCHSQTPTYAGKRHKKHKHCKDCGQSCSKKAERCLSCSGKHHTSNGKIKIGCVGVSIHVWPSKEEMERKVWEKPTSTIAKEMGCSQCGLLKHCKTRGITVPPRGYWVRRQWGYTHEESLVLQAPQLSPAKRLSAEQLQEAKTLRDQGYSYREIGERFGFAHTSISKALKRVAGIGLGT